MEIPTKIVIRPGYSAPKIKDVSVYRCNASGNADDSGTYFKIEAERNYCSTGEFSDNRCQIRYCYRQLPIGAYSAWATILDANNLATNRVNTAPLIGTLSADESYEVIVGVADTVGSEVHTSAVLAYAGAFLHKHGEMNSIAIGEVVNEQNTVSIAEKMSVNVKGRMGVKSLSCTENLSVGGKISAGDKISINGSKDIMIGSIGANSGFLFADISDSINQTFMSNKVGSIQQYFAGDEANIELRNYVDNTLLGIYLRYGNVRITGLTEPTSGSHAVNKAYVDVNFAPAGYGLGEKCITVSSWDKATKNGFYTCEGWSGYVTAHAGGDISQECFGQMSGKMYKRFRWYCDGSWKEWEWVNPPMAVGVEYRTTKRYQGKPVYTACFSCGNLPASGTTETIWNPPDGGIAHIFASHVTYGNNQGSVNGLGYKAYSHNFNEIRITNEGGDDWSGFAATALIEYWKE